MGPLDVAEYKRYLVTRKKKPATVNRALASIRSFFSWAVGERLAGSNPAGSAKSVKSAAQAPKALDRKEQLALVRAVQRKGDKRDVAIVTLLLHTGMRVSELCALDVGDVVLNERSGSATVRHGKGGKRREVPLNATARRALKAWLEERGGGPGPPLFTSRRGGGITPRGVEYMVARYAYDARLEDVTPHTLRHAFCKQLIDAGESLDRVAVLAGHASLNTTARYARPTVKDLARLY